MGWRGVVQKGRSASTCMQVNGDEGGVSLDLNVREEMTLQRFAWGALDFRNPSEVKTCNAQKGHFRIRFL